MEPSEKLQRSKSQRGANLVEYLLLCALIMVVAVVAVRGTGVKVSQRYSSVTSVLW
jgi:Flp pilus assembly pilin Flp